MGVHLSRRIGRNFVHPLPLIRNSGGSGAAAAGEAPLEIVSKTRARKSIGIICGNCSSHLLSLSLSVYKVVACNSVLGCFPGWFVNI